MELDAVKESASEVKETKRTSRSTPGITLQNRQRAVRIKRITLQAFAERVLGACLKLPGKRASGLRDLDDVNVILVSDRRMAQLHHRFLKIRGATDVITFQHGEIFVSTETARKQAGHFGTSLEHELRLYIAHGLLHLHGFDDKNPAGAAEMARMQEKLVTAAL